ncbi:hypothetical protein BX285_3542 [Streptomyces sp. 1114.5]|uniref:hypothetical protein n=1 Tax=unclassified Streptomyces TaxID=2593676 RepID=UPI000BD4BCFD|nr:MULTISPECIES: hypothetical protein [unclassified Streptomyces]RKT19091.1 hypothetical protein BX285_3542 [Streptomyces sp. 1114.5]SOB85296.1 hypothetical protein SAMN06272789_5579 [Streptomyces sp. 1331.2]
MVFGNIFESAGTGAGLFSVISDGDKPEPGADVDFEDSDDETYDDTTTSLFTSGIHGANNRAKIVQEQSPEARAILGFLGSFVQTTQASAGTQAQYAKDPGSVSTAAAGRMRAASPTVTQNDDLQKAPDLVSRPKRDDYKKPPKPEKPTVEAPEPPATPEATKPTAEAPEPPATPKATKPTAADPSSSQ